MNDVIATNDISDDCHMLTKSYRFQSTTVHMPNLSVVSWYEVHSLLQTEAVHLETRGRKLLRVRFCGLANLDERLQSSR